MTKHKLSSPHHYDVPEHRHYFFQNKLWFSGDITREENKKQHFAKKKMEKEKREEKSRAIKGRGWPQTFKRFEELPVELRRMIIRIAAKEAIEARLEGSGETDKDFRLLRYLHERGGPGYLRDDEYMLKKKGEAFGLWPYGLEQRKVEVLKRYELVRGDCLGGLLGTSCEIREEVLRWLESRRVRGWEWEHEIRSGMGQGKKGWKLNRAWKVDGCKAGAEKMVRPEEERSGKRRDVRMWGAAAYYVERMV